MLNNRMISKMTLLMSPWYSEGDKQMLSDDEITLRATVSWFISSRVSNTLTP
jgi:hypothetical protein